MKTSSVRVDFKRKSVERSKYTDKEANKEMIPHGEKKKENN